MRIEFRGGPLGLEMLARELRAAGVEPRYEPPVETRSAGEQVVEVTMWVLDGAGQAVVGAVALAAVERAVAKVRERFPRNQIVVRDEAAGESAP